MWMKVLTLVGLLSQGYTQCSFKYDLGISDSYNLALPFYPLPFNKNDSHFFCSWDIVAPINVNSITIDCSTFKVKNSECCFENSFTITGLNTLLCSRYGRFQFKSDSNIFRATYFSRINMYPELDCDIYVSGYYAEPESVSTTASPESNVCRCGRRKIKRIVGGEEAGIHEFPWQAVLYIKNRFELQHICGATLIGSKWVLTAAHCVDNVTAVYEVGLGEHHLSLTNETENTILRRVTKVHKHENYIPGDAPYNDVAILELSEPVKFSDDIHPICFPDGFQAPTDHRAIVTGWGITSTENVQTSQVLVKVTLKLVSDDICFSIYGGWFDPKTMICTLADVNGRDACQGDSGGPLIVEIDGTSIIVGVVSWGNGCGQANWPGVYARVTTYEDWIKSIIKLPEICIPY